MADKFDWDWESVKENNRKNAMVWKQNVCGQSCGRLGE
jgi:hypothetical protein